MALQLLQVGFGGWGLDWTKKVRATPEVEVVGIADMNSEALALAAEQYELPETACFASFDEALAETSAEAVLITAGAAVHVPLALAALEANKHVLTEKPFALTLADAKTVVETARTQNRILMVSQNYRFFPAPAAVRELIAQGALGELASVQAEFRFDMARQLPPGHPYFSLRDPLLLDMSIHHFDLLRYTLGEARTVTCESWNPPRSPFVYDAVAAATIELVSGATVTYQGSWLEPKTPWGGVWRLEGSRGQLTWSSRNGQDLSADEVVLNGRRVALPNLVRTGRQGVLRAFAEAVSSGQEPPSSGAQNLGSLALTLGAISSAATAQTVTLGPDLT